MDTTDLPRLSLNQRVQHAALALAVLVSLGTGIAAAVHPEGGGGTGAAHFIAGLVAVGALAYHLVYVAVRGYVEAQGWNSFPLRWTGADTAAALVDLRAVLAGSPRADAGEYRPSQKALYWWTLLAVGTTGLTGIGLGFWEHVGTLGHLEGLAALHRGVALLLMAAFLWHLYGVFTWEGRWWPEWSWLSGRLDAGKAARKLPAALREHRARVAAEEESPSAVDEDQRARERQLVEREEVEAELEKGNRLALAEQYVEALYHYRRALELFPGYSQARYNMARVLSRMGEREAAVEAYRAFLEAEPFHPLARTAQEAIDELTGGGRP